jgi:hypothetical protein
LGIPIDRSEKSRRVRVAMQRDTKAQTEIANQRGNLAAWRATTWKRGFSKDG